MYLAVVTCTNVLNVAFFTQSRVELEGSAMAFQFLLSSVMACRLVLSLRDNEARALSSAAADVLTRSFWRTGHTGYNDASAGQVNPLEQGQSTDSINLKDRQLHDTIPVL